MKFTIEGRLSGLNEYTNACRNNRYSGNNMKKKNQESVIKGILKGVRERSLCWVYKYPVKIKITWYEPNKRRDIDNVTFGTKFILDALVQKEILKDDSQKYVNGIEHIVLTDKENPRIEVEIIEGA